MCKLRWIDLKHLIQYNVFRSRWQPLFTSDHMSYPHHVIVYDIGKMVGWVSITLHDYLVIYGIVIKNYLPMN